MTPAHVKATPAKRTHKAKIWYSIKYKGIFCERFFISFEKTYS